MSGLFCGLYLRRAGWAVDIFERSFVALTGRGAGIMTHAEMHQALAGLGLDTSRGFGVPVERRLTLGADGQVIAERRCPQTATSWNRLFELLAEAFGAEHYHLGKDLRRVEADEAGVTACFSDGSSQSGDLLIGADGFRSTVRAQFLPETQPQYAGYVAWRGLADERAAAAALTQELFESFVFHLPPGEQFLGYPVAGPGNDLRPGHRSWNIVWYRPADAATDLPRLLTDESGSHPPAVDRAAADRPPRDRRHARGRGAPVAAAAAGAHALHRAAVPAADLRPAEPAHGRRPRGPGGRCGLRRPSACRRRHPEGHAGCGHPGCHTRRRMRTWRPASPTTRAQRLPVGAAFIARARRLGIYLRYRFASEEERSLAAIHAEPDRVMAETAVLDFLRD